MLPGVQRTFIREYVHSTLSIDRVEFNLHRDYYAPNCSKILQHSPKSPLDHFERKLQPNSRHSHDNQQQDPPGCHIIHANDSTIESKIGAFPGGMNYCSPLTNLANRSFHPKSASKTTTNFPNERYRNRFARSSDSRTISFRVMLPSSTGNFSMGSGLLSTNSSHRNGLTSTREITTYTPVDYSDFNGSFTPSISQVLLAPTSNPTITSPGSTSMTTSVNSSGAAGATGNGTEDAINSFYFYEVSTIFHCQSVEG